ncbi:DUF3795 domain-containing protein [Oceanidesulfovibrio marinus]|uniref:DUF3795 domain-containing protein n=1 Tax=Oceanidesulfovibrio marinus TaxID=370038 RepID=A0A6P1ZJD8_9BACT|nr:DUF3795 domain-containing protein [Oceanidesulfovibrio marinus]QJT10062.1 DUF3795 domain-containing protein [Oceanidesulfovibrio marinus]TVM35821.1 DUF3795 domain-containing protein [Oceanidesulfovibrio marinus]
MDVREAIAPCGLSCEKCLAMKGGSIQTAAAALLHGLRGFEKHAERFASMNPAFAHYEAFSEVAEFLASGSCTGCRTGTCLLGNCHVQRCVQEKGIGFCYECADFPCPDHGLPGRVGEVWKKANARMAEVGPEQFREETRDKPRY